MSYQVLDIIFFSLADATRRDILKKVSKKPWSIGDLSNSYDMSLNAVSKHVKVLERSSLVVRHKVGKYHYIKIAPFAFKDVVDYLSFYKQFWDDKLDSLQNYLEKDE